MLSEGQRVGVAVLGETLGSTGAAGAGAGGLRRGSPSAWSEVAATLGTYVLCRRERAQLCSQSRQRFPNGSTGMCPPFINFPLPAQKREAAGIVRASARLSGSSTSPGSGRHALFADPPDGKTDPQYFGPS